MRHYSIEPEDKHKYTKSFDDFYTRFARPYDGAVKYCLPFYKAWVSSGLPHIRGPSVLEVACGTGWLLTQYAQRYSTYAIDYNHSMVAIARKNVQEAGSNAKIVQGSVECLPFPEHSFDTVLITMAFTGFPDGKVAMGEIHRVLKKGGRLVCVDVNYPSDRNCVGTTLTGYWKYAGDIIRDMWRLFAMADFDMILDNEVGGFGSVHLYVAVKRN
mmetsp:Transcript_55780/g.167156  ORF Transcript_55780/g.167156 Transcript_55780/m.167156 type:complete len:214 (-) Transcript_55780:56-697(-)